MSLLLYRDSPVYQLIAVQIGKLGLNRWIYPICIASICHRLTLEITTRRCELKIDLTVAIGPGFFIVIHFRGVEFIVGVLELGVGFNGDWIVLPERIIFVVVFVKVDVRIGISLDWCWIPRGRFCQCHVFDCFLFPFGSCWDFTQKQLGSYSFLIFFKTVFIRIP